MYTISQWKKLENNKLQYLGDWKVKTIDEGLADIFSLKISGAGCVFAIENDNGTVVDVIHR